MTRWIGTALALAALAAGGLAVAQGRRPARRLPAEVREAIDLPAATEGTAPLPDGADVVQGAIRGARGSEEYFLGGEVRDLKGVKETLWIFTEVAAPGRDSSSPSEVPVVLFAGGDTRWRVVQWFLQACGDPDVRIHRISIAVETEDGPAALPVPLPTDRGLGGGLRRQPPLPVTLKRRPEEDVTRFVADGRAIGLGNEGFAEFREVARSLVEEDPARDILVNGWPEVPLSDIVRVVGALRAAGAGSIIFRGTAMPEKPLVWRLPENVRKELDPPTARTGVEVPEGEKARFEVAIAGPRRRLVADGGETTLEGLLHILERVGDDRRDRESRLGLSLVPVLIHADRDVEWREIEWVLQVCADPDVLTNRVHFAVRDREDARMLPVWLPTEDPPEGVAWLKVDLEAPDETGPEAKAATAVKLRGEELGRGATGFDRLRAALLSVRKKHPDRAIHAEVAPTAAVAFGDVVRVVDELRAAKITEIRFLRR